MGGEEKFSASTARVTVGMSEAIGILSVAPLQHELKFQQPFDPREVEEEQLEHLLEMGIDLEQIENLVDFMKEFDSRL
ncbi:hypothetical protein ACLOJK_036954 [Asimina triloba]